MSDLSRRTMFSVLAGAVFLAVVGVILLRSPEPSGSAQLALSANGHAAAAGTAGGRPAAHADLSSGLVMVADAMGAPMDAARLFDLGFAGGLILDRDTRAAIEAIINSMPDEPTEQDKERLERTLRAGMPTEEAEKAFKLVLDYRAYTNDVQHKLQPQGIPANIREANALFDQMEALKRRHFDEATAAALFGADDAHARLSMEAMFVQQDASMNNGQKNARLDALRARLPADKQALIPRATDEDDPAPSQSSR